ncbi:MAG: YdjY domain-containing protein, partial [Pirellulaceae bacterium]
HAATGKTMTYDWVFAGSGFYKDPETGTESYLAEGGDLICVANFPSATMDLAVRSADSNSGLVFMANTEAIPEQGTPVRLVLEVVDRTPAGLGQSSEPAEAERTSPSQGQSTASQLQEGNLEATKRKETPATEKQGGASSEAESKRSASPPVASPPSTKPVSGESQGGKGG